MADKFRVISWNIRAGGGKRVEEIFAQLCRWNPDVIGLCEFRGTPSSTWLAAQLQQQGYPYQISTANKKLPAKNALLLASRLPLRRMHLHGMPTLKERWILARTQSYPRLAIGLMHAPNYTSPELKYPFLQAVQHITQKWRSGPGIILGDTNCGRRDLDEENPFFGSFQREHDFIVHFEQICWADSFRYLYGEKREFTWYSHRNNGFRLDHAFCNSQLVKQLDDFQHIWGENTNGDQRRESLSDHAAMVMDFTI